MGSNSTLALVDTPRVDYPALTLSIETLVETYSESLYCLAFSILKNPADAEDAVQETFLRVVQHRDTLSEIENVAAWLHHIVCTVATAAIMRSFDLTQDGGMRNFC
jgi:DNA-directed RNA polymerase specialized sigma24 family protein